MKDDLVEMKGELNKLIFLPEDRKKEVKEIIDKTTT